MSMMEFYIYNDDLWCMKDDGTNEKVEESNEQIVGFMFEQIREFFPDAMKSLMECYKASSMNVPYYQYLIVRRFCKCNFGLLDSTKKDVERVGVFNFERVHCPLRGRVQV